MFADMGVIVFFWIGYLIYSFFKNRKIAEKYDRAPVITEQMIKEAMNNRTFGDFTLPPAVGLFKNTEVIPAEGYKVEKNVMPNCRTSYRIIISASAEKILDILDSFLMLVGDVCHVVIEDYRTADGSHMDHFAYHKDTFIVRSILMDFEDLLLKDGFLGIVAYNELTKTEVQLTKYKIIQVLTFDVRSIKAILVEFGIPENHQLKFIYEGFHLLVDYQAGDVDVEALKDRLCIDQSIMQSGGFEETYN